MIPKFTLRNQHDDAAQRINSYDKKEMKRNHLNIHQTKEYCPLQNKQFTFVWEVNKLCHLCSN